jgi:hypothetical protein
MILTPDTRPYTGPEVERAWINWIYEEHMRLQQVAVIQAKNEQVPDFFAAPIPQPKMELSTTLLTDEYVLASAWIKQITNILITYGLTGALAWELASFVQEQSSKDGLQVLGLLCIGIIFSIIASQDKEVYEQLVAEQQILYTEPKKYQTKLKI